VAGRFVEGKLTKAPTVLRWLDAERPAAGLFILGSREFGRRAFWPGCPLLFDSVDRNFLVRGFWASRGARRFCGACFRAA
jgi:hypothetical protein